MLDEFLTSLVSSWDDPFIICFVVVPSERIKELGAHISGLPGSFRQFYWAAPVRGAVAVGDRTEEEDAVSTPSGHMWLLWDVIHTHSDTGYDVRTRQREPT